MGPLALGFAYEPISGSLVTSMLMTVLTAGALAVIASLIRAGVSLSSDFVIRHRPGAGTKVRGRVPAAKVGAIAEFFARDLKANGPVTVRGSLRPGQPLQLRISGALDAFRRQRIRNFLLELLR